MTDSASTFIAIVLGLGVFLTIVAIGWRSVQHRRILRMQGADGQETIIVAREDDEITSVVTTTETAPPAPGPSDFAVDTSAADSAPAPGLGRNAAGSETAADAEADAAGRERLDRVVSSTE